MIKALSTALAIALFAAPVAAQQQCGPRERFVQVMAERFGEARQVMAMTSNGMVLEIFANVEKGNWTALVSRPDGQSCVVAAGEQYQHMAEALEPAGIDG